MAEDDRPTDAGKLRRRGKAPTLTLEATDITPADQPHATVVPMDEPVTNPPEPPAGAVDPVIATGPADAAEPVPATPDGGTGDAPTPSASGDGPGREAVSTDPEPPVGERTEAASGPAPSPPDPGGEPEPTMAPPPPPTAAQTPSAAAPPYDRPGPGVGSLIAAGVVGALLTGALAAGAYRAGYLPAPAVDTAAVDARLAALDRRIGEVAARPVPVAAPPSSGAGATVDLGPLIRRLDTLDAARATLETRIAALEARPRPDPAAAPSPAVDLDPLNREIEALKAALGRVEQAQRNAAAAPASPPPPAGPDMRAVTAAIDERIREALAPQATRAQAVESRLDAVSAAAARQVEAAESRIAALAGDLAKQAEVTQAAAARLATLDQARLLGQRAVRLVGIEVLRSAVDRGGAYAAELRGALALGIDPAALEPLSAAAERGVPTRLAVQRGFASLAPQLARAEPAAEGGFLDRLAANAQGLVRIRPAGEAAGDSVPAVVARVEAKLARGDLAGALADFDALPEPVKAKASDWAGGARARLAADRTLARVSGEMLAALAAR